MNIALIGAVAAMLCWGIGDFLIQRSTRKIGDVEALAWIGIVGVIGMMPFVIKDLTHLSLGQNVIILLILGVITFVAAIFDFEALKEGKISVIDMVLSLELPFTIMLGILFFDEKLTLVQFLIIVVLMWGVSMISMSGSWRFKLERGVWMAVIAAIGMAGVNFLTALSAVEISPLMAVWFPWLVFTLLCLIIIWKRNRGLQHFKTHVRDHYRLILGMGIFDTAAWLFYAYALTDGDLGIITAITESYPVVAMVLGLTIGGERITHRQYFGAAIALCASVVLALML
jgi:drug/metabolite transporter (DMT)-like permease